MTDSQPNGVGCSDGRATVTAGPLDQTAWLRDMRWGLGLLFWSLLLPIVAVNLAGFLLPLLVVVLRGAPESLATLFPWVGIIYTAGGVPLLIAAFVLTRPAPGLDADSSAHLLRRVCRVLAVLELLGRLGRNLLGLTGSVAQLPWFGDVLDLVSLLFVVAGLLNLRRLALRLSHGRLADSLRTLTIVYVVLRVASPALWMAWDVSTTAATIILTTLSIVTLLVPGIWGLALVLRLRKLVHRRLEHRCIHCGYDLRGTTSGVCSECGQEVNGLMNRSPVEQRRVEC